MLSNTRPGAQTRAAFLALAVYSILHQLPSFLNFFLQNTYDDGFVGSSKPLISIIVIMTSIVTNTDPLGRFQIANNTSEKGGLPNQG